MKYILDIKFAHSISLDYGKVNKIGMIGSEIVTRDSEDNDEENFPIAQATLVSRNTDSSYDVT